MSPSRNLFVFERVLPPRPGGFSPSVDVFYLEDPPRAVVQAELAGIDAGAVTLEVHGRTLVLAGERRAPSAEGRVFQQLEIEHGRFRRKIELGADVVAESAQASYEDGILRVELPLRQPAAARTVPVQRGGAA